MGGRGSLRPGRLRPGHRRRRRPPLGPDGFVVYTNQHSRKGRELAANPQAALLFGWLELNRQVRIEGPVEVVDADEADAYWRTRPRASRVGAWASAQSDPLVSRAELDERVAAAEERFDGADEVPRPDFWGGYRVGLARVEFWQGRPDRLHDRFEYVRTAEGGWDLSRLSP